MKNRLKMCRMYRMKYITIFATFIVRIFIFSVGGLGFTQILQFFPFGSNSTTCFLFAVVLEVAEKTFVDTE